jgi:hypothetical protein
MSNIFLESVEGSVKDDPLTSLNDTSDLTRMAYSNKSSDIPLRNSSLTDRFESDTFINNKESFESNNSRINSLNEEIRELKMKCREIYEKEEEIKSLKKQCETLTVSLENLEKFKNENEFLKIERKQDKEKIESLNQAILDSEKEEKEKDTICEKIPINIDKLKQILSIRLKDTHEKHIDDLINQYGLSKCESIEKSIIEELVKKAIHI